MPPPFYSRDERQSSDLLTGSVDGDSVHVVLVDDSYVVCRLMGIDAPEQGWADRGAASKRGPPLAHAATEHLILMHASPARLEWGPNLLLEDDPCASPERSGS
jgi:endonuclease YncB( thermonuclease family)